MTNAIADHWGTGDVYSLIVSALNKASKPLDGLTVEDLAPVDHFHARGFPATVELADRLPVRHGQHILDIGCGLGGLVARIAVRVQLERELAVGLLDVRLIGRALDLENFVIIALGHAESGEKAGAR